MKCDKNKKNGREKSRRRKGQMRERESRTRERKAREREGRKGGLGIADELHMVKSKHFISQP